MSHGAHTEVRKPGPLKISVQVYFIFLVFILIGVGSLGFLMLNDTIRAWSALLQNYFFFFGIAIGGLFIAAIQWLTGAMWSSTIRRVSESFTAYIPWLVPGFVALYFGLHSLYIWTHADHVAGDPVLEHKAGYLNPTFFLIRNAIAICLWIFFAKKMVGNSLAQDKDSSYHWTEKNKFLAPIFLIVFALSFSMASFDLLMSLDPHWFSTMFGVYCFAGSFNSALALTTILVIWLVRRGDLKDVVNANHLHDLGKFLFAFTIFWAYIAFSQYMLIWYANLPEETMYFMTRLQAPWRNVSIFLLLGKFLVPFFALLPREAKRSECRLLFVAAWMLMAQWVDLSWLIQPETLKERGPHFAWEAGVGCLFLGVFGIAVLRFLTKNPVAASGDPKYAESVLHHSQ